MTSLESLSRSEYPRAGAYDPQWQVNRCMGPHPLWLLEDLLEDLELEPGMRVMDLGCGLGMTSTFLAREFGVQVTAVDPWIAAAANERRFARDGVAGLVSAVSADARRLPFDESSFDVVISIDAFHYFGTDDLYIGEITRFLRPGGTLAIASPGSVVEPRELGGLPEHVRTLAGPEALSFHTHDWWRFHWDESRHVAVTSARSQPAGWSDWLLWCEVCAEHARSETVREGSRSCIAPLQADGGRYVTFVLLAAQRLGGRAR